MDNTLIQNDKKNNKTMIRGIENEVVLLTIRIKLKIKNGHYTRKRKIRV